MNITFDDYSEVKCNQSVKTPELEKFLDVPWEVPKLRKKIANRKKMKTLVNIQADWESRFFRMERLIQTSTMIYNDVLLLFIKWLGV